MAQYDRLRNIRLELGKDSGTAPDYGITLSYGLSGPSKRRFTFDFGNMSEVEEDRIETHADEFTTSSSWQATDRELRDGELPYDERSGEKDEKKYAGEADSEDDDEDFSAGIGPPKAL